ncbi:uncharacterized protein C5L36_0E00410 [Pichia kudriavzevii]|uniref:Uncharacterized protein n=1 Tax=Pichia kudriavzevii TaxID=4909 RepID=A0A2U9R9A3_PICKU|nr:uncharacterized protein C5L36_0E00410 [Pichia kudriavzevii]AWU77972.1 hypothetical protein C5L36_0E00410 [Pichia kudriavzevii]
MAKRKGGSNAGKDKKRQRSYTLIEPGTYGLYATCPKFKEVAAAKEMRLILQDAIDKYYPEEKDTTAVRCEGNEKGGEAEVGVCEEVDIEDEIAKEIKEIKKNDDKAKHNRNNKELRMREIPIGVESLVFFKLRQPIKPSEIVVKMCNDLYESKAKMGRFIQRIVAIDRSCNATENEFKKLLEASVDRYVHDEMQEGKDLFESYNVNLVKRNFDTISRDEFMEMIQGEMDTQFGEGTTQLRYKGARTLINVYCFKNNIGIGIVKNKDFERLCKFNVQQIFEKVMKEEDAA